jgi:hypothetical protein
MVRKYLFLKGIMQVENYGGEGGIRTPDPDFVGITA